MIFLLSLFVFAAQANAASKTEILIGIAKALGEIGDSIIKITDGIKHVIVTGEGGVSYILAKNTENDLRELSALSTQFSATSNMEFVESIDDYLLHPTPNGWKQVRARISNILSKGSILLSKWDKQRSDFIAQESYANLLNSLNGRMRILMQLQSMDAPTSKKEINALREVNKKYKALILNFRKAIQELNNYIKTEHA